MHNNWSRRFPLAFECCCKTTTVFTRLCCCLHTQFHRALIRAVFCEETGRRPKFAAKKFDSQDETITWVHPEDFGICTWTHARCKSQPPSCTFTFCWSSWWDERRIGILLRLLAPSSISAGRFEQEFQPHHDAGIKQEFQFFFNPTSRMCKKCSWTNLLQSH